MGERRVDVFFYGSYINFAVLGEAGIDQRPYDTARLPGFELVIAPLANLRANSGSQAYGILTRLSHAELHRLYTEHARDKLGGTYLPEAVLVFTADNALWPALCYMSHEMQPGKPDPGYVERILSPAREYGFPAEYLRHIESFKQRSRSGAAPLPES